MVLINWRWHCYYIEVAVADLFDVGGADEAVVVDGVL